MKHSDFEQQHAWMCGLSEYFRVSDHNDDYELLFRALYHDNKYRKRDLLFEMHKRIETDKLWGGDPNLRSFYNTALYTELEDYQVNARTLIGLISWFVDDNLVDRVYRFLTYFVDREQEIPNLIDFFSRGQVKSKLWMVTELAQIVDGPLGNIVFYGGWYNFLAHFLYDQFDVDNIYSIDIDESVVGPSERLYVEEKDDMRFHCITHDVSKIKWDGKKLLIVNQDRRQEQIDDYTKQWTEENADKIRQGYVDKEKVFEEAFSNFGYQNIAANPGLIASVESNESMQDLEKEQYIQKLYDKEINCVVNTSCEHMNNEWFENLPDGTFVVLQTNDYFENEQHSNCCKDLEDAKSKYPMKSYFYEGELDTQLYNRFMLIGIK